MGDTLPTISTPADVIPAMKIWQRTLQSRLRNTVSTPIAPKDFSAVAQGDGVLVSWSPVDGADGYEILAIPEAPDFSGQQSYRTIVVNGARQDSHFDRVASDANPPIPVTMYYKIRATSGSPGSPNSIKGDLSGITNAVMTPLTLSSITGNLDVITQATGAVAVTSDPTITATPGTLAGPSTIPEMSMNIVSRGGKVLVIFRGSFYRSGGTNHQVFFTITRDGTTVATSKLQLISGEQDCSIVVLDQPGAGTHTYAAQWSVFNGDAINVTINNDGTCRSLQGAEL